MVDIAAAYTAVTSGLGALRTVVDAHYELDKADLKMKMAEAISALSEAKIAMNELQERISTLETENARIIREIDAAKDLVEGGAGLLFETDSDGKEIGYPYCPVCYKDHAKLYRLSKDRTKQRGSFKCPKCKSDFSL